MHQLGQNEADVLLLAFQCSVIVAVVVLLIPQREDGRQRVQLGGDVRIQGVRAEFSALSISQELQEAPGQEVRKTGCLLASKQKSGVNSTTSGSAQVRRAKVGRGVSWQFKQTPKQPLLLLPFSSAEADFW